jgi:histidinol-phosphatase (PHP family)
MPEPVRDQRYGSYHNHLAYCDGAGTAAEYAAAALAANLRSVGLSCHAPVPFASQWNMPAASLGAYLAEVRAAQTAWADRLPVRLGLEMEYLAADVAPDGEQHNRALIATANLDYAVVSMHYVGRLVDGQPAAGQPWSIDSRADQFAHQLTHAYGGDARRLMEDYWSRVAAMAPVMASWGLPVIAGHIDKGKMWNISGRYFDEAAGWYLEAADAALAAIAAHGLVVELNTAGLSRPHGESYPGPRLLRRCAERGIPVTISADAHQPANVANAYAEAAELLRAAGHQAVLVLDGGGWVSVRL